MHLTGAEWQAYLMMGIHGACVITARGSSDPIVDKLSGVDVTVKHGSTGNSIDVTFNNAGVTVLIISPSVFTATVS